MPTSAPPVTPAPGPTSASSSSPRALIIGNSDGIGLALTRRLLDRGWSITGISRSPSPITPDDHDNPDAYDHHVVDIRSPAYDDVLDQAARGDSLDTDAALDLCVYCAGIGEEIDFDDLAADLPVFEVNLIGLVRTVSRVLPAMLTARSGHFIGLSSQGDRLLNVGAPSYSASKAGVSSYLESLGVAVRDRGVAISNIRFGFVATKMAKADVRPFEITADDAASCIERCIIRRPLRYTYPRRMAIVLALANAINRIRTWFA